MMAISFDKSARARKKRVNGPLNAGERSLRELIKKRMDKSTNSAVMGSALPEI